jgi:hypothetical protein
VYVRNSTNNPLGWRPWNFALSNSGLAFYYPANFVIPTSGRLGDYVPDDSAIAMQQAAATPPPAPDFTTPLLVIGAAGLAAWWWMKKKGKSTAEIFSMGKI